MQFFPGDMKKAGFDTEEFKSIVSVTEDGVASVVAVRNLSRFLFCLSSPVLMQPFLLSHLKILKNECTERKASFL